MATNVVVVDSAARRHQIKTTPNKSLSEVLEEVCTRLNVNSHQYGLKHNNKQIDLSRTIRLSGLTSGAKLQLVQLSKSAGVVSVALQLPEAESHGVLNGRLTDKFPSTTTLWLVLRKFEAGVAGGATGRNLTAKAMPSINSGAGKLYYQQPVIQIMSRELSTFTELQNTLAQLGFNSGSVLLRLSFRFTQTPLEESMAQIQEYFDSIDAPTSASATESSAPTSQILGDAKKADQLGQTQELQTEAASKPEFSDSAGNFPQESELRQEPEQIPQIVSGNRPVSAFAPPSASTPSAVLQTFNDTDYVPTVEHAQIHQKMLQQATQNKRLPTDAELEEQAAAKKAEWDAVKDVELKVRFPDQTSVIAKFGQSDNASTLYSFARGCLEASFRNEPFVLKNPGIRGEGEIIPDNAKVSLIKDLKLRGRVLVVFGWDEQRASLAARGARHVLKQDLRTHAQQPVVPKLPSLQTNDTGIKVNTGKGKTTESSGNSEAIVNKLPKWLKGLTKK